MEKCTEMTIKSQALDKEARTKNGSQNLVTYCQSLFAIEDNDNYYNTSEYRNAKREFIKYLENISAV